jgi:hypothetical protein
VNDHPPAEGRKSLGADLVIPALALAFAAYFFHSIQGLSWEAKSNGVLIGTALVILIVVQVARIAIEVARGRASLGFDALYRPRAAFGQRIALVLITVAFIATIKWLGVTLGIFLGLLASLWILGIRKPKVLFLVSFITAAAVYTLFIAVLDASFPHGPVENLIGALIGRAK